MCYSLSNVIPCSVSVFVRFYLLQIALLLFEQGIYETKGIKNKIGPFKEG
jgi:hypothetical protein